MSNTVIDQLKQSGQEFEPMWLQDTTGSFTFPSSETDSTPRNAVLREAMSLVIDDLAGADSAGEHEEGGGGLRMITFAGGSAQDLGDINPGNFSTKWHSIHWRGGTQIMPGYNLVKRVYNQEFGRDPNPPALLLGVCTDGAADDIGEFETTVSSTAGNTYIVIALVGYGSEYQQALNQFNTIARNNPHVAVVPLGGMTDPRTLADAFAHMLA